MNRWAASRAAEALQALDRRAIDANLSEITVRVVGYDDLIRIRRAVSRPQSLADIAVLEDARRS